MYHVLSTFRRDGFDDDDDLRFDDGSAAVDEAAAAAAAAPGGVLDSRALKRQVACVTCGNGAWSRVVDVRRLAQ